jgi:hypothetical protein
MAFGAIGIFGRMTPAIENILQKNALSLQTCETMLAELNLARFPQKADQALKRFKTALIKAQNNITEKHEAQVLENIEKNCLQAFRGNKEAIELTINNLRKLSSINHAAMASADANAQQMGHGGAWAIVFMALLTFTSGVIFIHQITNKLLIPIAEIKSVLIEHLSGETKRRCTGFNLPRDIRSIYGNLNQILDRSMHNSFDD